MKIVARPIDVVASFCTGKKPVPRKFRFYGPQGERDEVRVDKILQIEESRIAGIEAIVYTCQSAFLGEERLYQLKYIVARCSWELYKV